MPAVSIIIPNYNGIKYLKSCIDSLKNNSFVDFELIVVDNGSVDKSVDYLKENYPEIKVIALSANLGLSIASNKGSELAAGKYLFFYNNDTIADKEMLGELVRAMESNPRAGICGCRTFTYDGSNQINSGVHMDAFGYPYGKGRPFYVDAGIFIRKGVFDELGGFDSKLFLYCEDRDICWRCLLYGYDIIVVDSAKFYHDSFCAIDAQGKLTTNIKKRFMGEAFTLRMVLKNYSIRTLFIVMPLYFLINLAEIFFFSLCTKFKVVAQVYFKAYLWNIYNLKSTLRARRIIQASRRVSDSFIQSRMFKGSGKLMLFSKAGIPNLEL